MGAIDEALEILNNNWLDTVPTFPQTLRDMKEKILAEINALKTNNMGGGGAGPSLIIKVPCINMAGHGLILESLQQRMKQKDEEAFGPGGIIGALARANTEANDETREQGRGRVKFHFSEKNPGRRGVALTCKTIKKYKKRSLQKNG